MRVVQKLRVKSGRTYGIDVTVHYFEVELLGGEARIQDPDGLICDIAWKSVEEIGTLVMSLPEDRAFLLNYHALHTKESD